METPALLDALADGLLPLLQRKQAMQYGVKHDSSGTPIAVGYSHGPGGVLTFPGVDPDVFHSVMGNISMLGMLPTTPSLYTNPTYYTITGVQDITGAEPAAACSNAPTAGLMKACMVSSVFGRYSRATAELDLTRLGKLNDRADPMDLRLVGSPIAGSGVFTAGPGDPSNPTDLLVNEVSRKFWERNVAMHRLLSQQLWQGNPVNNNAGGGYREISGFGALINTGYVDAETHGTCPSVDSYLLNFNNGRIDIAPGATNIVRALTDMYYQMKDRANRTGMTPVRWVIAMRPQMFYELTAVWPCSYLTQRCQLGTSSADREFVDAQDQIRFRDEMRTGKYLLIDGERVEVIVDDGIPEQTATQVAIPSGCFRSDIYMIPMSVVGGRAVTFLEYYQYSNPMTADALGQMILGRIEGAFLTVPRQTNNCVVWQSYVEPRLVVRTPWLAARLQNVVYCPVQHTRDTFPTQPYFVDGGKTSRPGPSFYNIWSG